MRIAEYERKIAERERKVGQLTMEVDLLKEGARLGRGEKRRELLHSERPSGAIEFAKVPTTVSRRLDRYELPVFRLGPLRPPDLCNAAV